MRIHIGCNEDWDPGPGGFLKNKKTILPVPSTNLVHFTFWAHFWPDFTSCIRIRILHADPDLAGLLYCGSGSKSRMCKTFLKQCVDSDPLHTYEYTKERKNYYHKMLPVPVLVKLIISFYKENNDLGNSFYFVSTGTVFLHSTFCYQIIRGLHNILFLHFIRQSLQINGWP